MEGLLHLLPTTKHIHAPSLLPAKKTAGLGCEAQVLPQENMHLGSPSKGELFFFMYIPLMNKKSPFAWHLHFELFIRYHVHLHNL